MQAEEKKEQSEWQPSPGSTRPTQLITTHGPGSFVQTENDSVMVLGIDFWSHKEEYRKKYHLYMQNITKKDYFLMPSTSEPSSRSIPCISFPTWGYCRYCKWLQLHKDVPGSDKGFVCTAHPSQPLLPARLVTVCKRGHIDDFPWIEWAHSSTGKDKDGHPQARPICESPKVFWKGGKNSSSIAGWFVECECGARNYMGAALDTAGIQLYGDNGFYTLGCSGKSPWLDKQEVCKKIKPDDDDENSTELPIGILGRSTSLYYSKILRGIIIPQLAHPIIKYLQSENFAIKNEEWVLDGLTNEEKAQKILRSHEEFREIKKYTIQDITEFMDKLSTREGSSSNIKTESDLKKIEYEDLMHNQNFPPGEDDEDEKEIMIRDVQLDDELKKYFKVVRRLDILTALEVQRYFTRLNPPGEINEQSKKEIICNIEVRKQPWLPCVIKKGEGIFLVFNENFIKNCMNKDVEDRLNELVTNHKEWEELTEWPSNIEISSQYIFLHSLSHLLIKEFALRSGYSEASISERIYSSDDMCGILIYTTSSGDGSLGGLVRQTEGKLLEVLEDSLRKAKVCSRDPICLLTDPKKMRLESKLPPHLRQNASACYGCMLLPETSCEFFNKMLDRKVLVDPNYGLIKMI